MESQGLNYQHLYYFAVISREGGVAAAGRKLHLTHSTLSAQLRSLEEHLGARLFDRKSGKLVATPLGRDVLAYANDIFRLGHELVDMARGREPTNRSDFRVGVVGTIPKTLTHRFLQPSRKLLGTGVLYVKQDPMSRLLEELVAGRLHLILADSVPSTVPGVRIHAHLLGESRLLLYASKELARKLRRGFPKSCNDKPFVLPAMGSTLRHTLDDWFAANGISPSLRAEVDDAALLRTIGASGLGLFPVREALRAEVDELPDVMRIGNCEGASERYFALTVERKLRHPAVVAIVEAARTGLGYRA